MCGIYGVVGQEEASNLVYLGLYALQHRGQEGAGIVSSDGKMLYRRRRPRLVSESFDEGSFKQLPGDMAIGHVRYSTTGTTMDKNVAPFLATGSCGTLAVAHNGTLVNFPSLRRSLEAEGALFQSTMDSEVFLHLAAMEKGDSIEEKIQRSLPKAEGAYSVLFLTESKLIAARDPHGFRPLCLGRMANGQPVLSSESCAFDLVGAKYEREIQAGEMVIIERNGEMTSIQFAKPKERKACVFEHIYFARPDSFLFGESVYKTRLRLGRALARECNVQADVVIPVPDSGMMAAMGFAEESGIPLQMGLIRNHYVGRTFIEPKQSIRGFGVKIKLNPVRSVLQGKRVVVIDDSIVRGTTCRKIVKMLRDAGASQVVFAISSPPTVSPCYYGIDTPTKEELIASNQTVEDIRAYIGADKLVYLSLQGMYDGVKGKPSEYCDACFSEKYPTKIELPYLESAQGS